MSWDIFVQDFPVDAKTIEDIPVDFAPRTIGRRSEVIEKIKGILPDADFSDPSWGRVELPECSMEINMGEAEEMDGFAFHVHGGEKAPATIVKILQTLKLRAVDNGTGDFLDTATAVRGFEAWRDYRDQVMATVKK